MDADEPQSRPEKPPATTIRVVRRVPGSFDDDEISPAKEHFDAPFRTHNSGTQSMALKPENIPPLDPPAASNPESSFADGHTIDSSKQSDSLVEQAVRDHLQDIESSFAAPISPLPTHHPDGVDDTYVFDSPKKSAIPPLPSKLAEAELGPSDAAETTTPQSGTPQPMQASRLPEIKEEAETETGDTTSSLEVFSSSPTAAAAARTVSRAISLASAGNARGPQADSSSLAPHDESKAEAESEEHSLPVEESTTDTAAHTLRHQTSDLSLHRQSTEAGNGPGQALQVSKRPKYLRSRNASQRSSVSSFNNSDDVESDITVGVGADYALQSGGAIPALSQSRSTSNMLSRSISMGSMASGIEDYTDSSGRLMDSLETLDEEDRSRQGSGSHADDVLQTPRVKSDSLSAPTDTVIARHVRNVQVPESLAKEYRNRGNLTSPRKTSDNFSTVSGLTTGTARTQQGGRNLTLKEQSSTIERLSKENFDLKLKVMFLSERLDKLSEEGIKEMISENVELKTALAVLQRENKGYRRRVKELEKQLSDEEQRPGTARQASSDDGLDQEAQEQEEELFYLRERVEEYMSEIEKLRSDGLQKEADRRRMAEVIKSFGDRTSDSVVGRQEEVDVWKDLLEQETARREQADDDNDRLRQEVFRLKRDLTGAAGSGPLHHTTNIYNISKKARHESPSRPVTPYFGPASSETANGGGTTASSTLADDLRKESEQLRHENAELRREVSAQTSMLTSRNREKERLYQEIEDLKLAQRRGGPAPSTIDSLLERSASRAGVTHERSHSPASGGTRAPSQGATQLLDDPEREEMENKMAEMRDRNNELKLQCQNLQRELDGCMEDFEAAVEGKKQAEELVAALQEDLDTAMNDLVAIQSERDEALREQAELEAEFEALRKEAQEEIDALEAEADQRNEENQRLQLELGDRTENFEALQEEMRKMSEALVRLEDEQDNKLRRIQQLEQDLGDANKDLEDLEARLLEANDKAQRLGVQQESSQGEIAFLREEQEGDKIRIGDLEAAIATAEQNLRDELERIKELEERLAAERRQREIVATQEKEDVQQFVNELNREASAAKDEARKLRKSLTSREVEATEWKERLMELENNLREALGDLNGTRSSLLKSIAKLQRELENTVRELETTKASLSEKDRIIKQRDSLLESHGLESRKLAELLDKERQAHRNTKNQFDTFQNTHQHVSHTVSAQDARIHELELAKAGDKRKLAQLETHFKEQLTERNNLLLVLWTRLSALCGSDWAHDNSLINGRALPSLEAVATMLPGFSKNLLAAIKNIESMMRSFQGRIKGVEKDLWREYHSLETHLDARIKKLDRLEATVRNGIAAGTLIPGGHGPTDAHGRMQRLEEAYRQLKVENTTLRAAADVRSRTTHGLASGSGSGDLHTGATGSPSPSVPTGPRDRGRDRASRLPRTDSFGGVERGSSRTSTSITHRHSPRDAVLDSEGMPLFEGGAADDDRGEDVDDQREHSAGSRAREAPRSRDDGGGRGVIDEKTFLLRLRDMETKLRKEREARLQDRGEASKRIVATEKENLLLREYLEKEKARKALLGVPGNGGEEGQAGQQQQQQPPQTGRTSAGSNVSGGAASASGTRRGGR